MEIREALTFDDVMLVPGSSDFYPSDADVSSVCARGIKLNIPVLSAAMDTVTESDMAIAMAQAGGLGVIHRNLPIDEQRHHVARVKRFESAVVDDPITLHPNQTVGDAHALQLKHKITGFPVVDEKHRIVGILTNRDLRFLDDPEILVCDIMTSKSLITTRHPIDIKKARQAMRESRVEKVIVLDDDRRCIGLLTISDIEKSVLHPQACKDDRGRLRVAAASTIGDTGFERSIALIDAGADVIAIDTAHGHSKFVIQAVERLRKYSDEVCIIAGNVATADGVRALADAGADGIKVGIGPGSICTTRIIAGVGIPQITAIMDCAKAAAEYGIPVIADGGVKFSGDIAKAIAAGASCVMVGSILAGTDEAPGEIFLYNGRSCKSYRGMGSIGAMAKGAADRYFQNKNQEHTKFVPEGVEGQVPCKGLVSAIVHQLVGGLRAAMGYTGNKTISEMQKNSNFVRITACGLSESHVHNVQIVREAPNYHYGVKESL